MRFFKVIALTSAFFIFPSLSVAAIKNTIEINSNTGNNTASPDSNQHITTGSSTTSVNINNSIHESTSSSTTSTSKTTVKLDTDGGGTNQVKINNNSQQFELTQKDGQTLIKTTDSQGNVTQRQWQARDEMIIHLDDGDTINIQPAGDQFTIVHKSSTDSLRVYTNDPLSVDQSSRQITLHTSQGDQILTTPPALIKPLLDQELDEIKGEILITSQNDQLVYQTSGTQTKKILHLIPHTFQKNLTVSAHTGHLLDSQLPSPFQKFLYRISS